MTKKVVSALLLLLVVAGTVVAEVYTYTCTRCGMIQQFNQKQISLKCSKCGSMTYQAIPGGRVY